MIFDRDAGICGICDLPVAHEDRSVDHIVPISGGGTHDPANWQLAHSRCNSRKGGVQPPRVPRFAEVVTISLRLPDDLLVWLRARAQQETRSINGQIIALLTSGLDEHAARKDAAPTQ